MDEGASIASVGHSFRPHDHRSRGIPCLTSRVGPCGPAKFGARVAGIGLDGARVGKASERDAGLDLSQGKELM